MNKHEHVKKYGKKTLFVIDSMHGKLARFLRILGENVFYPKTPISDNELIRLCSRGYTVLITGDRMLYKKAKRMCNDAVFIKPGTPIEVELLAIVVKYGINTLIEIKNSRCPYCNTLLAMSSEAKLPWVKDTIYVCPSCGNYYWRGRHWIEIERILSRVEEWVKNQ